MSRLAPFPRVLNTPNARLPDIRPRVLDVIGQLNYAVCRAGAPRSQSAAAGAAGGAISVSAHRMAESLAHLPVITEALHGVEGWRNTAEVINPCWPLPHSDRVPAFSQWPGLTDHHLNSPLLGDFRRASCDELVARSPKSPCWLIGRPRQREAAMFRRRQRRRCAARSRLPPGRVISDRIPPSPACQPVGKLSSALLCTAATRLDRSSVLKTTHRTRALATAPSPADGSHRIARSLVAMPVRTRQTANVVPPDSIGRSLYAALRHWRHSGGARSEYLSFQSRKSRWSWASSTTTRSTIRSETIGPARSSDTLRIDHLDDVVPQTSSSSRCSSRAARVATIIPEQGTVIERWSVR